LQYNRARWYDPATQRWTSRDPIEFAAGDGNLYRYVGNDPADRTDPTGLADWADWVAGLLPQRAVDYLASRDSAWVQTASNVSAGAADTLSGGATAKVRQALGYDDVVDKSSAAYRYGGYAGQAINVGLLAVNPAGWASLAVRGINLATAASGFVDAGQAALAGDPSGLGLTLLNVGLAQLRGAGSACAAPSRLAGWAQRGLAGYGVAAGAAGAVDKLAAGDVLGGLLDLAQAGASARRLLQPCFVAGTPLLTPAGSKPVERFAVGDLVLARPEFDPEGPLAAKVVEAVFVRTGRVLHLHLGGQVIRTTPEHPFWVKEAGWRPAGLLKRGDLLSSHEGGWVAVEEAYDTGEYETVYNLRVADWHTYFVGGEDWGFSVWAHNAWCAHRDGGRDLHAGQVAEGKVVNTRLQARLAKWKEYKASGGKLSLKEWAGATSGELGGVSGGYRSGYGAWDREVSTALSVEQWTEKTDAFTLIELASGLL
jgi:hypothetical protein